MPDIGSPAARLGARLGARPGAGFCARFEHLLPASATKVALTAIAGGLPMIDPRLPSVAVAAATNGMCGPIPGRGDVDVVAAPAPVDVAAPIAS